MGTPGRRPNSIPTLLHHKATRRGYVRIRGRNIYLGPWGADETEERYRELVRSLLEQPTDPEVAGRLVPASIEAAPMMVADLCDRYVAYVEDAYRKRGQPTQHALRVQRALELFYRSGVAHELPPHAFGPRRLKAFQSWLAADPARRWSRKTINEYVAVVVSMFKWAVSEELAPAAVHQALTTVAGLRKGRAPAPDVEAPREGARIEAVTDDVVEATLAHAPRVIADMARVQRFAAMRPAEVIAMHAGDLEAIDDGLWAYRVRADANKLEHLDINRIVWLGPRSIAIVRERIERLGGDAFIFPPADAWRESVWRRTGKPIDAQIPDSVGETYTRDAYRRAIHRACDAAGVARWSPNRLRHSGCTEAARTLDIETARRMLGHSDVRTTMRYMRAVERDRIDAVREIG